MSGMAGRDADVRGHRALAVASRVRLLGLLRAAGRPVGVAELVEAVELHPNTVRAHLDVLVDAGLATRADESPTRPGRPRAMFAVAEDSPPGEGQRRYQLLAEILAGYLASAVGDAIAAGVDAGREWGRYLVERPRPFEAVAVGTAVDQLVRLLEEMGFQPELSSDQQRVDLRACPFLEVAERHRDVVCGVHLGLMQGVLAELRVPVTATQLDPLVHPRLCIAELGPVATS